MKNEKCFGLFLANFLINLIFLLKKKKQKYEKIAKNKKQKT